MKKLLLSATLFFIAASTFAQNVGIGTATPTDAKLQVVSADNSTQAMFSNGTSGIAFLHEFGRPSIGLNMFYNGGYKFKGAGWASLFYYKPADGTLTYYTSTLSGSAGGTPGFSSIMTLQADGNVGIGTTSPTEAKLQVFEPAGNTQFIAAAGSNLPGISTFVPVSSPSLGFNARYQSGYKFMGPGYGSFFQYTPSVGKLSYYYSSTSGVADGSISSVFALVIDSSGQLGIGTSTPKAPLHVTGNVVFGSSSIVPATGYKVSIDGKVICEELKVQLNASWPDYVFKKNYTLLPLQELERSIMQNQHLPNIPSAAEVAKDGILVGDMNKRLLEKVEELTLYLIDLDKKNTQLTNEVEQLKKQVQNVKR